MGALKTLTDATFKEEIESFDKRVLVEFWASWCPPCKMMDPLLVRIQDKYADRVVICKLNVDQNRVIAAEYSIAGVPTFITFDKGNVVERTSGALNETKLLKMIGVAV
ncbi:thioredoxin [bacterium E08(2017)]|nr:thioredoxin [bacterium E08(2017)]